MTELVFADFKLKRVSSLEIHNGDGTKGRKIAINGKQLDLSKVRGISVEVDSLGTNVEIRCIGDGGVPYKERIIEMLEVGCRQCENCTGHSCKQYGENADESVTRCANDEFKNYKPKRD